MPEGVDAENAKKEAKQQDEDRNANHLERLHCWRDVATPNEFKLSDRGGLAWLLRGGLCGEQQA